MIISEAEIRKIIKKEILKKEAKRKLQERISLEKQGLQTQLNIERVSNYVIKELNESFDNINEQGVYGDTSLGGGGGVTYTPPSANPYEGGGGSQETKPTDPVKPDPVKPEPKKKKSGKTGRYAAGEGFPLKNGMKDPKDTTYIADIQGKLGLKADGMFGPKTEAAVKKKYGVKEVSQELYNKIMGKESKKKVDMTVGQTGDQDDAKLGDSGKPRQETRQAGGKGTKYRIQRKGSGRVKIDPAGPLEGKISAAILAWLQKNDPGQEHKKPKIGRLMVDGLPEGSFGKEDWMKARVGMKGDIGRLALPGKGRAASKPLKAAIWKAMVDLKMATV